jgi:hypothetical protein
MGHHDITRRDPQAPEIPDEVHATSLARRRAGILANPDRFLRKVVTGSCEFRMIA